jgi:transcriptional regulator with XRE-family HTH domain
MNPNCFAKNLRSERKELGINQEQFAKPLDITGSYLSDIERGKAVPKNSVLQLIEIHYRINRNWLLTGEGSKYIQEATDDHEKRGSKFDGEELEDVSDDQNLLVFVIKELRLALHEQTQQMQDLRQELKERAERIRELEAQLQAKDKFIMGQFVQEGEQQTRPTEPGDRRQSGRRQS